MPSDEPYSPESGGAVATVGSMVARALDEVGVPVQVVSPFLGATPYREGSLTELRHGRPRSFAARALARLAARGGARDGSEAYAEAATAALRNRDVVVHNAPRLGQRLATDGHTVTCWLHNLLPSQDGDALRAAAAAGVTFVAVSAYVRDWTAQHHGVDAAAVEVIHNGIDVEAFRRPAPASSSTRGVRAVIHGRVDPNKGQLLAARSVAHARAAGADVSLTVLGAVKTFGMSPARTREYERELRDALDDAGAAWAGHVPRSAVPAALHAHDVSLALPTVPEPFSLAALEGMAAGCATVAVPVGGLAEVVGDAALRCGPVVEEVSAALVRLARDPALVERLSAAGVERAARFDRSRFDAAVVARLAATR